MLHAKLLDNERQREQRKALQTSVKRHVGYFIDFWRYMTTKWQHERADSSKNVPGITPERPFAALTVTLEARRFWPTLDKDPVKNSRVDSLKAKVDPLLS